MSQDYQLEKYVRDSTNEDQEPIKTVRPRYVSYADAGKDLRGERSTIKILSPRDAGYKYGDLDSGIRDQFTTSDGFAKFFLQNINVAYQEKTQVVQTFGGADVVYYFGQAPVQFQLSGLLFDDVENRWFIEFAMAYQELFRGTRLAQNQQLVQIDTPNLAIVGTISSFTHNQNSSRDTDIQFGLGILAQKVTYKPITSNGVAYLGKSELVPSISLPDPNLPTKTAAQISTEKAKLVPVNGYSNSVVNALDSAGSTLKDINSTLSSLTDDVVGFLNNALSPVNDILGAVRDVSNMAISLARNVESSAQKIINVPMELVRDSKQTEALIKNAAGTIAFVPESISTQISRFVKDGRLDGTSAILSGSKSSPETAAILASRPNRTGDEGASL